MTVRRVANSPHWYIRFMFRGEIFEKSTGTDDHAQAVRDEVAWKNEVMNVAKGALPTLTLKDVVDSYWKTRTLSKRRQGKTLAKTESGDLYRLNAIREHFGDDTHINDLAKDDGKLVRDWMDERREEDISPGTINRNLTTIISLIRLGKAKAAVETVPTFKKLEYNDKRDRLLTYDEEAALLRVAPTDLQDLIVFLVETGGRRKDALKLRWCDVSFEDGTIHFRFSKPDKTRMVPMMAETKRRLQRRWEAFGKRAKPNDTVFRWDADKLTTPESRQGKRGRVSVAGAEKLIDADTGAFVSVGSTRATGLRAAWERALALAKVEDLTMHDLRHAYASRLRKAGVSLDDIGELLGHTNPKMTKRYAHVNIDDLKKQTGILDALREKIAAAGTTARAVG